MLRALRDVGAAVTCLQLLLLVTGAEPRPRGWDEDRTQLEAVKKGILERLGMSAPPVVRQRLDQESIRRAQRLYRHKVAEVMRNRSRQEEEEGSVSRTRRLQHLTPTLLRWPDGPQGHQDPRGPYRYRLVLSHTETFHRQLRVVQAELKLFKKPLASHATSPLATAPAPRVSIYVLGGAHEPPKLLRSQELDGDTLSLDITAAVRRWAAGAEDALRLELAFTANVTASLAAAPGDTLLLEVETHEPRVRRARRARGLEEECGKSDGKCCLKSLKVSFQDIGWSDWVIAPNSYYMRFCEGSCPHNYKPASMHAQIKARMHSLSKATPPPCCVPAAYDPMVLMHYDGQGRLVSTVFEDMLVTKCHCA